jgi:hypothetical protein
MNTEKDIIIISETNVVRVQQKTWAAFLKAAGLVIDTGDMYPLLDKIVSESELKEVKDLKIQLDDYIPSSS